MSASLIVLLSVISLPSIAYAHVVVTPNQANIGQEIIFNVSVPNEKESAVTNIRLIIPDTIENVAPTTKES